ncbi:M23 family metallopeptidase [Candidatus Peregrinibacteria bacterium]|nr:M23 family metallopeptidase [Candidatus Peregrinibacteria bacterium]
MQTPTQKATLWTIFLTLTVTYTFVFVAKVVYAERTPRTSSDNFPPLECAISPFGFTPDWGSMDNLEKLSRSFCHIDPKEFIPPPPYDITALKTPLEELNHEPKTQVQKNILTMKLFYSTRHFGIYDLDSDEYVTPDHPGIDFKMPAGTLVYAIAGGIVNSVEQKNEGLGNTIILEHRLPDTREKVYSIYGHLSHTLVHPGESVSPGSLIGTVGTTGNTSAPHLHLQIDRDRGLIRHIPYIPAPGITVEQANRWTIHPMEFIENY